MPLVEPIKKTLKLALVAGDHRRHERHLLTVAKS